MNEVTVDNNAVPPNFPTSTASDALQLEALKALKSGVKPEDLATELRNNGAVERAAEVEENRPPAPQRVVDPAPVAIDDDVLYSVYLQAFLRLSTGKIEGLSLAEMEYVAALSKHPAYTFAEWKQRMKL